MSFLTPLFLRYHLPLTFCLLFYDFINPKEPLSWSGAGGEDWGELHVHDDPRLPSHHWHAPHSAQHRHRGRILRSARNISWFTKYIYIKSTTVYVPLSELGLSQPLSRQRVWLSPQNWGRGDGLGESQFRRLEKNTLPTLWLIFTTIALRATLANILTVKRGF